MLGRLGTARFEVYLGDRIIGRGFQLSSQSI